MEEVNTLQELGGITISQLITGVIVFSSVILLNTFVKNIPGLFNRNASKKYVDDSVGVIKKDIDDLKVLRGNHEIMKESVRQMKTELHDVMPLKLKQIDKRFDSQNEHLLRIEKKIDNLKS
jgi:hypothetical protein